MIKTIEREDGKRYQVYGYRNGKKVYIGTRDTRRAAVDAEEEFRVTQRKIADGRLPPETDTRRRFGGGIKIWLGVLKERESR